MQSLLRTRGEWSVKRINPKFWVSPRPNGIGLQKPFHYVEMVKLAWNNQYPTCGVCFHNAVVALPEGWNFPPWSGGFGYRRPAASPLISEQKGDASGVDEGAKALEAGAAEAWLPPEASAPEAAPGVAEGGKV